MIRHMLIVFIVQAVDGLHYDFSREKHGQTKFWQLLWASGSRFITPSILFFLFFPKLKLDCIVKSASLAVIRRVLSVSCFV